MKNTPEAQNLKKIKDKISELYVQGVIPSEDAADLLANVRWAEAYERRRQDTYEFRIKSRLESLLP